jgi:putative ABC transport system ATP-binding protein
LLKLDNVTKVFNAGTPDEKLALDNINLHLKPGDFVTTIGSNGAGKSTLMNIIAGVIKPESGSIMINNQAVNQLPEHQRAKFIGRVFQDPMAGTAPNMSIIENLSMALSRGKTRRLKTAVNRKNQPMFREYLEQIGIGLENRLNAKVGMLSGGERQALSLLMATFTKPDILLLDEHTAALDPNRAHLITQLTETIVKRDRLTTLMVTHNMEQAIRLGNRLIMMDKGKIIMDISEEEKQSLTVKTLLEKFKQIIGEDLSDDRVVLG